MLNSIGVRKHIVHLSLVILFLCILPAAFGWAASAEDDLARMRQLQHDEKWPELLDQFKSADLSKWPNAGDAFGMRGCAYLRLKDAANAQRDLEEAVKLSPKNPYAWHSLGETYRNLLNDDARALDAYNKAFEMDIAGNEGEKTYGWMPIDATLKAASILLHQTKYEEALKVMERYNDSDVERLGVYWGRRMLRAYGILYAAMGREAECLAKFHAAIELEEK